MLFQLFRKTGKEQENIVVDAATIAQMKRQLRKQVIALALSLTVAGTATFAFGTQAWFAMNKKVAGNDMGITSMTASPSLYIRKASDDTKVYAEAVTSETTTKLFPSSTADLTNWYYASGFTFTPTVQAGDGYTYTISTATANAYTKIASFTDEAAGTYDNDYEKDERTAYYLSEVNLYTTDGDLDVYLDSTDPITVEYDPDAASDSKVLLNALRVGISVDGTMKFIYAPVAESGTGNSDGSAANTFYYISGGSLTAAGANVLTSLSGFAAQKQDGSDVLYEPVTSAAALCTATEAGVDVSVYVWLEGTDAQALYGLSDNDLKGINVTVNYVGVEPD